MLNYLITRYGILIDMINLQNILGMQAYKMLCKKLEIVNKNVIGYKTYVKQINLYKILIIDGKSYFNVARFANIKIDQIHYINYLKSGIPIPIIHSIKLEIHQHICLNYLMDNVYNLKNIKLGRASCIFVMDTGLGKTFTAAGLIEKIKEKTLIILPNKSNIDGWYEPFTLYLKNIKVGEYNSTKKCDGDVVIMTIESALSASFIFNKTEISSNDYFKQFGLVIYDEIHNYPTTTQQEIFWRTNFKYGLGLTATPDERIDHMDIIYYKHVGPIINAINIPGFIDNCQKIRWKGRVLLIKFYGSPEYTERIVNSFGWTDVIKMQQQFKQDPYRNKLILNIINEKIKQNRNIFVFAIHRSFLNEMFKMIVQSFPETDDYYDISDKIIEFMGGATTNDKEVAKNKAQVILTTYSFGKESISFKKMDTIILAQPIRNKMRQIIGRILRIGGDTTIEREIIDICDVNTTIKSQFTTRKQIYKEKGFPIEETKVDYSTIHLE